MTVAETIERINAENKAARKHYRESSRIQDAVAEALPINSDWSPTIVAEWICQSWLNHQTVDGKSFWFDLMTKREQFSVAKSICERLVKQGRAEKALGCPLRGRREVMTYNGVRKA